MEFLSDYGLFLAKSITIIITVGIIVAIIAAASSRGKAGEKGHIEVTNLNEKYDQMRDSLKDVVVDPEVLKLQHKEDKKKQKEEKKAAKKAGKDSSDTEHKSRTYVLNFDGDIKASATESLREEISAVLMLATDKDEVVLRLESGGGMVHSYGLASSQLARIKSQGIPLTVCVDKVAASGGYMMACVADKILAAPFAILGSIGVVAQLPNFHRLLKKNAIDFELLTAGEHKRTLTMFGENTDKDREKFIEDLEDTHDLFKGFVSEHREQVDISDVANGDVWFGKRALDKKLIDELKTSDEYLMSKLEASDIYEIEFAHKKSLPEKLGIAAEGAADRLLLSWLSRMQNSRFFS
ncbi:protease SohB [Maricurvus nonylphenolicus]|uniref:protease SohB n=1 Tax=Maricurvus nonylphenolicus TaxID=1008307 RepID=UPI0036F3CBDA